MLRQLDTLSAAWQAALDSRPQFIDDGGCGDLTRYASDPLGFCRDILGVRLWRAQREIIEALADPEVSRVTCRSCHGAGKTRVAACAIVWALHTHEDALIVNTAPTFDQVQEILWPEVAHVVKNARFQLPGRLLTTSYEIGPKWKAIGRSTNKPERFSGFHASPIHDEEWELTDEEFWAKTAEEAAQSSYMMLVVDEASGVEERIYIAAAGFLTTPGSRIFLIGNPTIASGTFYNSHHPPAEINDLPEHLRRAVDWKRFHISAYDVMREAPRLYSAAYIHRAEVEWGRDSPMWKSRVLGEFPVDGPDVLCPLSALELCRHRIHDLAGKALVGLEMDNQGSFVHPVRMGIDCGGQGEGETVVYVMRGCYVEAMYAWNNAEEENTLTTTKKIGDLIDLYSPQVVNIDQGAHGIGIIDNLKAGVGTTNNAKYPQVVGIDFGAAPTEISSGAGKKKPTPGYRRLRDEMNWFAAQEIRMGRVSGITDETTKAQASVIKYTQDRLQKVCVETKDELRTRGYRSPDRWDALTLAIWKKRPGGPVTAHAVARSEAAREITSNFRSARSRW